MTDSAKQEERSKALGNVAVSEAGDAHMIPFLETYGKADDDTNRLDGMELCQKP
jgi:hypothetical protein